jgi:hypothetical protein
MQQAKHIQQELFGKMYQGLSAQTEAGTSSRSSRRLPKLPSRDFLFLDLRQGAGGWLLAPSWEIAGRLPGVSWTLNTGECPSAAAVSSLSQILELDVQGKYFLSRKAGQGILRRAETRGKILPEMLKRAISNTR